MSAERTKVHLSKLDTAAIGIGVGETATLGIGLATGDWLLSLMATSAGFGLIGGVVVKDMYDLIMRLRRGLEITPDSLSRPERPIRPPRVAKYQPNSFNTPNPQTAIYLADVPVGDYARVYPKTGRLKDKFGTETNIAKIIKVKETPQKGNEMVTVQIDGWMDRKVSFAAGTAAIRLGSL